MRLRVSPRHVFAYLDKQWQPPVSVSTERTTSFTVQFSLDIILDSEFENKNVDTQVLALFLRLFRRFQVLFGTGFDW